MIDRNREYPSRITAVRVSGAVSLTDPVIEDAMLVTYDAATEFYETDRVSVEDEAPANRRAFNSGVRVSAARVGDPCWIRVTHGTAYLIVIEGGYAEGCAAPLVSEATQQSIVGRTIDAVREFFIG